MLKSIKFTLFYLVPAITLVLFPQQSPGAPEKDNSGVYTLGEIVVSGDRVSNVESIGTVREITDIEIESRGAKTLDEALKLFPGINLKTGGQGVPRLDMRGMRTRHVILLLDGIPVNSAGDGQFDPRSITVENISKIKVSYGNDSVLYGPGGLGGVINVITKKGTDKFKFNASAEIAEREDRLAKMSLSGVKGYFDFFISASDYESDGYRIADNFNTTNYEDGGIRENSDQERRNIFGNLGFSPNDKLKIGLVFNHINGEYGIPPITVDKTDPFGKDPKYERVDDRKGFSVSLSASYDMDGPLNFRGWVFSNKLDELKNGYDGPTYSTQLAPKSYRADESTQIRGGNLQSQYGFNNRGFLTFSLGTKKEDFDTAGWEIGKSKTTNFDETHEVTTDSMSAEYEVEPLDALGLVMGYGYSWFEKEGGKDEDKGSYLLGLNYDISDKTRLKGSVSKKVRFPSVSQLYGIGEANPDLTNEESMNYEIGTEYRMDKYFTQFSLTGFLRDVEGYISKDNAGVNQNAEKYKYRGIELVIDSQFFKNLDMKLGYTYMNTRDESTGTLVDEVQYNPKHKLTIEGRYDFGFDIYVLATIEHVRDQYYYNNNNSLKGKLPNYSIVNMKIEKSFTKKDLNLYVGANNIFDENYFESYALPREGRSIYGGVKYTF